MRNSYDVTDSNIYQTEAYIALVFINLLPILSQNRLKSLHFMVTSHMLTKYRSTILTLKLPQPAVLLKLTKTLRYEEIDLKLKDSKLYSSSIYQFKMKIIPAKF